MRMGTSDCWDFPRRRGCSGSLVLHVRSDSFLPGPTLLRVSADCVNSFCDETPSKQSTMASNWEHPCIFEVCALHSGGAPGVVGVNPGNLMSERSSGAFSVPGPPGRLVCAGRHLVTSKVRCGLRGPHSGSWLRVAELVPIGTGEDVTVSEFVSGRGRKEAGPERGATENPVVSFFSDVPLYVWVAVVRSALPALVPPCLPWLV